MLQLHPNAHHLPDNIWHTALIAAAACLLAWGGWRMHLDALDALSAGSSLAAGQEPALVQGEGQALYVWIEMILAESHPLLINRILSAVGWVSALVVIGRILARLSGFLLAIPSVLVLITFPGLTPWMLAGGSGAPGLCFFLLGFSSLLLEEHETSWIRGGVFCGIGTLLYPVLLLPSMAVVLGTLEWDRNRSLRAGAGCVSVLLIGIIGIGMLSPSGFAGLLGNYPVMFSEGQWFREFILKSPLLIGAAVMALAFGARKRGISWWGLSAAFAGGLLSGVSHPYGWVPFLVLFSLALVKVPVLLDIRHPRSIQSVFLCQLLLWIPVVFS